MSNDHTPQLPSMAQLDNHASRVVDDAEARLAKQFEVKDGKFLGLIPIPEEFERTFGLIIGPITTELAGGVGKFAARAAGALLSTSMLKGKVKDPEYITKIAQTAGMGLVTFSRVIMETYGLTRDRAASYLQITKDTKAIADEIGASADNKVLNLAFRKYHESWGTDIKKLIPGVVQAVSMMPYAAHEYNKIWPDAPLWSSSPAAAAGTPGVKKRSMQEVADEWLEQNAGKYSESRADKLLDEHLRQHGFNTSFSSAHAGDHRPGQQFDIMDLVTGKVGLKVALPALAGFTGPDFERWAKKGDKKKGEHLNTLEMIEALRERVHAGNTSRVHEDIIHIFQQFEKDTTGKDFSNSLLAERTKPIAEAIISKKLSVRGLIRLVGEDMVISHTGGDRDIRCIEEIEKSVREVAAGVLSRDSEMSRDKFINRFEKAASIEDAIRKNVAEFTGVERDFFVALMPLEVLEHTGLNKKEIRESRLRAQAHIYENVAAAVVHLAAKDEEYLKEHGMNFKEIQYLQAVSKRVMEGDMHMLRELVDNKKDGLTALVASGLISEQADVVGGTKSTWADRVKEGSSLEEKIQAAKAAKEAKANIPHADRHAKAPAADMPHAEKHAHLQHDSHVDRQHATAAEPGHPRL